MVMVLRMALDFEVEGQRKMHIAVQSGVSA